MAECPDCKAPNAYVGFSSIECRNKNCTHFKLELKPACGCCGSFDHETPGCKRTDDNDDSTRSQPPAGIGYSGSGCGSQTTPVPNPNNYLCNNCGHCPYCNYGMGWGDKNPTSSSPPPDWCGD